MRLVEGCADDAAGVVVGGGDVSAFIATQIKMGLYSSFCRLLYYHFAIHLPPNGTRPFGPLSGKFRVALCRKFIAHCGKDIVIEHGAKFCSGQHLYMDDGAGLGINCQLPEHTHLGKYVMMGPNCTVLAENHKFDRLDIPMGWQGHTESKPFIVEDDCWIGQNVLILPGRTISTGTVIGGGSVVTKDFPPYSVIGGNPARILKMRK